MNSRLKNLLWRPQMLLENLEPRYIKILTPDCQDLLFRLLRHPK